MTSEREMEAWLADCDDDKHDEVMKGVPAGSTWIVSDKIFRSGRFQVVVTVICGEFVMEAWQEDNAGWHLLASTLLEEDAAPRLRDLLRSPACRDPLPVAS